VIGLNSSSLPEQFDCQIIASAKINAMKSPASRVSVDSGCLDVQRPTPQRRWNAFFPDP
jgi:hypothetical protein